MTQDQNTDKLAKKVRTRKNFLNKVVNPVIDLVHKRGTIVRREQGSCHTRIVAEFRNFGDFTFHTDLGQTMFGGNTVKIFYHPGRNFREGGLDSAFDREWSPVLFVDFHTDGDYTVRSFNEKAGWQKALVSVLKNENKIMAQIEKTRSKAKKISKKQEQNSQVENEIRKEAYKLGLN